MVMVSSITARTAQGRLQHLVQIGKHGFIEDKPTNLRLVGVSSHKSWVHGGFSTTLGVMLLSLNLVFRPRQRSQKSFSMSWTT